MLTAVTNKKALPAMPLRSRQPEAAPAPATVNYFLVFKSAAMA